MLGNRAAASRLVAETDRLAAYAPQNIRSACQHLGFLWAFDIRHCVVLAGKV